MQVEIDQHILMWYYCNKIQW